MDEAARHDGPRPAWITARRQTGGRGRGGKPWLAPDENLKATWTAPADRPITELSLYSFVAALALKDALSVWIAPEKLAFKWPNDVLADGRKIAGILLESSNGRLSIGVGVNVAAAPPPDVLPQDALPTVAMRDIAAGQSLLPLDRDTLLAQLAADFERWRAIWAQHGFSKIRTPWLAGAANLGQPIRVRLPKETLHGTFRDVDETGCLVLQTANGLQTIAAGEVYFGG